MAKFQPEEQAKPRKYWEEQAIRLAMEKRWEKAATANRTLLELFPDDVEALNRLGKALTELGRCTEARQTYERALFVEPNNSIARKNLHNLGAGKKPYVPIVPKVPPEGLPPGDYRLWAVVQGLLAYWSRRRTLDILAIDQETKAFLRRNPFAFLMAACLSKLARAEVVWEVPYHLWKKLGDMEPRIFASMAEDQIEELIYALPRLPRFPGQAAKTIASLGRLVETEYQGDAARIWQGASAETVLSTLVERVWGVGAGIAHMTARMLVEEFGWHPEPEGLRLINVKPDVHLRRVFYRTGLVSEATESACVEAARHWHPKFPGRLDPPAWEIGREYCHEKRRPDCLRCPLNNVCPKEGIVNIG